MPIDTYRGIPITELSKDELIDALKCALSLYNTKIVDMKKERQAWLAMNKNRKTSGFLSFLFGE